MTKHEVPARGRRNPKERVTGVRKLRCHHDGGDWYEERECVINIDVTH